MNAIEVSPCHDGCVRVRLWNQSFCLTVDEFKQLLAGLQAITIEDPT